MTHKPPRDPVSAQAAAGVHRALAVTLWATAACSAAVATELRPSFNLPSQRDPQPQQQALVVRAVPQVQEQQPLSRQEAFFQKFAADARSLSREEAAKLRQQIVLRADAASRSGRSAEAEHYQRLQRTLDAARLRQ